MAKGCVSPNKARRWRTGFWVGVAGQLPRAVASAGESCLGRGALHVLSPTGSPEPF